MSNRTDNYIFISYSHYDRFWVIPFINHLINNGYHVWYDQLITTGAEWEAELQSKIANCKIFIALISNDYAISPNCSNELEWASQQPDLVKRIIVDSDKTDTSPILPLYKYTDKQFQVWDFANPKASFEEVQKYEGIQECRKPEYKNKPFIVSRFSEMTRLEIENIRLNHPSFRMLENHKSDEQLYPKGILPANSQESYSTILSLQEAIQKTWKQKEKTHLSIIGVGGIGKTVALLSLFSNKEFLNILSDTPVIYIPLFLLPSYKSIDDYILKNIPDRLANQMIQLSTEEWNGPRIVLLLDGYNEVALMSRPSVEGMIYQWLQRNGVMIIATSRVQFDIHQNCFETCTLEKLDIQEIQRHLLKYKISLPSSMIFKVIDTPLMLKIYTDVESFMKLNIHEIIEFKKNDTAGSLIYNYLQRELHAMTLTSLNEKHSKPLERAVDIAFSILCMSPFIAYKMASSNAFSFTEKQFREWIKEGIAFWKEHTLPQQMRNIEEHYEQAFYSTEDRWLCSRQKRILTYHEALFVKSENIYRPVHQNFRDGLSAIHLMNIANTSIPEALITFTSVISDEVLDFLADLLDDETLALLWKENKKNFNPLSAKTIIQLNYKKYNHDLSRLDFSGLDLSEINFHRFLNEENKLLLSTNPAYFAGTKLYAKCFLPQEHKDTITCLALANHDQEQILASAGRDHQIMLWNLKTGSLKTDPISTEDHVCKDILFTNNENLLIALNEDGTIYKHDLSKHSSTPIEIPRPTITSVSFLQREKQCLVGFDNGVIGKWDINTLERLSKSTLVTNKPIRHILLDSSQNTILCECNGTYVVIDKELNVLQEFNYTDTAFNHPASFDHDKHILILSDNTGQFQPIDYVTGMRLSSPVKAYENPIRSIAFNSDGGYFLTVSNGYSPVFWRTEGFIRVENFDSGNVPAFFECIQNVDIHAPAFYDFIRFYCEYQILRNKQTSSIKVTDDSPIFCCASNFDSSVILIGHGHSISVWNGKDNTLPYTIPLHNDWIRSVAVNAKGTIAVSGSFDGTIQLLDISSRTTTLLGKQDDYVNTVAINSDGTVAVSGSDDRTVCIWDIQSKTCKHVLIGHADCVTSVTINPEGTLVASASDDNTIRVWDVSSGKHVKQFPGFHDTVSAISFCDHSRQIICLLEEDAFAWNIENDETFPIGKAQAITASLNGNRVAILTSDHTIQVYDSHSFDCIQTIQNPDESFRSIALNEDGTMLVCCSSSVITLYPIKEDINKALEDKLQHMQVNASKEYISIHDNAISINAFNSDSDKWLSLPLELKNLFETPLTIAYDSMSNVYIGMDGGTILTTDISTNDPLHIVPGSTPPASITCLFHDQKQNVLLAGTSTGDLYVKDCLTGNVISLVTSHSQAIHSIVYYPISHDKAIIIVGCDNHTVSVYSTSNNTLQPVGNPFSCSSSIKSLAFDPITLTLLFCTFDTDIYVGSLQITMGFQLSSIIRKDNISFQSLLILPQTKELIVSNYNQILSWDLTDLEKEGKLLTGSPQSSMQNGETLNWSIDLSSLDFSLSIISDQEKQFFTERKVNLKTQERQGIFHFYAQEQN